MGLPVWTVVYVASGWRQAETMKNRLSQEGLLVMLRSNGSGYDSPSRHVELLVPKSEAQEAHSLIMQLVGAVKA